MITENINYFSTLPHELTTYILDLAKNPRQVQVCKLFREISEREMLRTLDSFNHVIPIPRRQKKEGDHDYIVRSIEVMASLLNHLLKRKKVGFKRPTPLPVVVATLVNRIQDKILIDFCQLGLDEHLDPYENLHGSLSKHAKHYRNEIKKKGETVTVLELSKRSLKGLPKEIGQFSQVKVLYLSENQLDFLPPAIARMKELQEIYLRNNQFTEFPRVLLKLKKLRKIILSNNQLKTLPPEITELKNLRILMINHNKFPGKLQSRTKAAKQLRATLNKLKENGCVTQK